jgi:hypothetical protein
MTDMHDDLDREARRVIADPDALGGVRRRADKHRLVHRVATGALALAIGGAGIGLAYAAFRSPSSGRPAAGPSASPTPGPTPTQGGATSLTAPTLEVLNATGENLSQVARYAILRFRDAEPVRPLQLVTISDSERAQTTSQILCNSAYADHAAGIEQALLPGAQIGDLPSDAQTDMQIILGQDFSDRELDGVRAYEFVRKFMVARHTNKGAEKFLTENAARQYSSGEGGLSLYEYDQGTHDITGIHRDSNSSSFLVVVRIPQWPNPEPGKSNTSAYETLEVGGVQDGPDGSVRLLIVYAERNE